MGGSPDGNEPLLEGNVNYVNTSYLTLHEIIALLPDHRHLGLTQNEIMNVARLIQFYETHRFNDCINNNTRYQPVDLLTMTFTSSPAYCVMYDADYNILCSIDFIKQKFKFFNQPYNESNNIFFQTYKSLNLFFSNFTFIQNSSLNRKGWYTGLDYSKPANRLKRALHNFKKPESITQLKQRMTNIKEMEMAHFKLDYRDFLT